MATDTALTPEISAKLKAPFANVSWRVQSVLKNDKTRARVVAYIDARDVMDRLDDAVGPESWSFDWEPVTMANNQIMTVKGKLTVCGITRCDIGEAGDIEKSKAAVSDALKRAAVHFGVGRWLYDMGTQWATVNEYGDIPATELTKLNNMLARRLGQNPGQAAASNNAATPPAAPAQPATHNATHNATQAAPNTGTQTQTDIMPRPTTATLKQVHKLLEKHGYTTVKLKDDFIRTALRWNDSTAMPDVFSEQQALTIKAALAMMNQATEEAVPA
jgi:hypothetical protein